VAATTVRLCGGKLDSKVGIGSCGGVVAKCQ